MSCNFLFFSLIVLLKVCIVSVSVSVSLKSFVGKLSNGRQAEYLDANKIYLVEWEAYTDTKTIVFDLTVATTGYVGFGISPSGGMIGADIVIAGIHSNGSAYISVRFYFILQIVVASTNYSFRITTESETKCPR